MTSTDTQELRICTDCCEIKPLPEFRRRYRDQEVRVHQCKSCHAVAERERNRRRREIAAGRRMQSLATAARRARNPRQLDLLMKLGVHAAGGLEKMLRDWRAAIEESINRGRATPRLLGFYETMTALVIRHSYRTSTDAELVGSQGNIAKPVTQKTDQC